MNIKQKIAGVLLAIVALLGGASAVNNLGGTAGNNAAKVATSSFQTYTAGGTGRAIASSTACASRIISTQGSEIRVTFNDVIPTSINGHAQAASTTVNYNAEDYGCGAVRIFPYAAQTITVTETR